MATTSDAGRADLFEHYAIEPDSDIVKAFNNQIDADGTSWAAQTKKGRKLRWFAGECMIGKSKDLRMFPMWTESDGSPCGPLPIKFPSLSIQTPAGPIKAWYVKPKSVLQYGNIERASQKVVFGDGCYPMWAEWCADMDRLFGKDRCKFLADNFDQPIGQKLLGPAMIKYGSKQGKDKLFIKLLDSLEEPTSHAQFAFAYMKPPHNIFSKRYTDGELLRVCPKDEAILSDPTFDPSNQIRQYLENPPTANPNEPPPLYQLNLLKITLPGSSDQGNMVLPNELGKLNAGAIASMQLTVYNVHSRDGCCSITAKNNGITLLTNGPSTNNPTPAVDMMSMLRAKKRKVSEE